MSALDPGGRAAGGVQARHRARRLPAAAARLRRLPAPGLPLPGPAARRRGRVRLPVPRGEPHLGRHHRQHAHRRVLLHLRHRPRPRCSSASSTAGYARGRGPWVPAALLAVTALAHGYAVLWAGLSASYFLYGARRPARTLGWLAAVAGLAFALAAFWLLPAARGLGLDDAVRRPLDHRRLAQPVPDLPVVRVRRWPRSRLAGDAAPAPPPRGRRPPAALSPARRPRRGRAGRRRPRARDHRRALRALRASRRLPGRRRRGEPRGRAAGRAGPGRARRSSCSPSSTATSRSRVARAWIDWNYTGLEAKEHWPAFRRHDAGGRGRGGGPAGGGGVRRRAREGGLHPDVRDAAVLLGPLHPRGRLQPGRRPHPPRLLPGLGAGRELAEPLPQAASTRASTPTPPSPTCACSTWTRWSRSARGSWPASSRGAGVSRVARVPPYSVFRLDGEGRGYVEPLEFAPVRSPRAGWRDKSYRWFTRRPVRRPAPRLHRRPAVRRSSEKDEWLAPPARPLPGRRARRTRPWRTRRSPSPPAASGTRCW